MNTATATTKKKVTVIGSINMDLVVRCDTLPTPGQTILASSSTEVCGGKGANQAVAAARAGGDVTMLGRVGDDVFAGRLIDNLRQAAVNCQAVASTADCASGLAIVSVEDSGQNSIIVICGANGRMTVADVLNHRDLIEQSDVLMLQLEIPIETVLAAKRIAGQAGIRVVLDPAPAPSTWPAELADVDLLCPNETEAAAICGFPVKTVDHTESALRKIHAMGARNVVITRGAEGAIFYNGQTIHRVEPIRTQAVDTTAAGDAFAGALAVRWAEGADLVDAVAFASAAGALAVSRPGAQPAMGYRTEIEARWKSTS